MNPEQNKTPAVEMTGIVKRFGSFTALDQAELTVQKGSIHALLGENGAGKSTLMNILYGLYQADEGVIKINGEAVEIKNPGAAIAKGIGMVHQHFMLVEPFTVTQNIILGSEGAASFSPLKLSQAREKIAELSKRYGLLVDPDAKIEDISVGMQQRVEILKALYRGVDLLILDEPTAVLTPQEIKELIGILRSLTQDGKTVIIITHKLGEIRQSADTCTVIRRGKTIDTVEVKSVDEKALAALMVGREVTLKVEKEKAKPGEAVLEVEGLRVRDARGLEKVKGLSLTVRRGEIVGIAGIDGNGQTELVDAVLSLRPAAGGEIKVNGAAIQNTSPKTAIRSGVAVIPEDRQKHGLVLDFTVAENTILENYGKAPFSRRGILDRKRIESFSKDLISRFDIRPAGCEHAKVRGLSGGNQQKVILAREITNDPDLLIAFQPTRGLDVGAIEYVHRELVRERDKGKAVLLVSLELDEVLDLSDRIAVIYDGAIVGELDAEDADQSQIGLMMAGGAK